MAFALEKKLTERQEKLTKYHLLPTCFAHNSLTEAEHRKWRHWKIKFEQLKKKKKKLSILEFNKRESFFFFLF